MTSQAIPCWLAAMLIAITMAFADSAIASDERIELVIDNGERQYYFQVELATTSLERRSGLQGRKNMAENAGMLFLVNPPAIATIWMKDTYIPLDILFIDSAGRIQDVIEETTPLSLTPLQSTHAVAAVLELNGGMCRKLGVKTGARVIY